MIDSLYLSPTHSRFVLDIQTKGGEEGYKGKDQGHYYTNRRGVREGTQPQIVLLFCGWMQTLVHVQHITKLCDGSGWTK